jgi:hypothetical protein
MLINAVVSRNALVHAAKRDWVALPIAGVEPRMVDRTGAEVVHATLIVR